jgi:hypothetical protein
MTVKITSLRKFYAGLYLRSAQNQVLMGQFCLKNGPLLKMPQAYFVCTVGLTRKLIGTVAPLWFVAFR